MAAGCLIMAHTHSTALGGGHREKISPVKVRLDVITKITCSKEQNTKLSFGNKIKGERKKSECVICITKNRPKTKRILCSFFLFLFLNGLVFNNLFNKFAFIKQ